MDLVVMAGGNPELIYKCIAIILLALVVRCFFPWQKVKKIEESEENGKKVYTVYRYIGQNSRRDFWD